MTDTKETDDGKKKLGLSRPGKLELNKTVETGQVKQNFSHGRSKMVTVEKKKKRTFATDAGGKMSEVKASLGLKEAAAEVEKEDALEAQATAAPVEPVDEKSSAALSKLTDSEREARMRALESARDVDADAAPAAPTGRGRPQVADFAVPDEPEPEAKETEEEITIRKAQEEEAKRFEDERNAGATPETKEPTAADIAAAQAAEEERATKKAPKSVNKVEPKKPSTGKVREERRRKGKLTIAEAESFEEMEEHRRSLASVKRQRERDKEKQRELRSEGGRVIRDVVIPETITVQELANRMAERGGELFLVPH